jgi:hypothetical protein
MAAETPHALSVQRMQERAATFVGQHHCKTADGVGSMVVMVYANVCTECREHHEPEEFDHDYMEEELSDDCQVILSAVVLS